MVITYPIGYLVDDSGAILSAPVVSIVSVKDKAGSDIASPVAAVNGSGTAFAISVDYDAETHGEAFITLSVSQATHTITGLNATIVLFCAKDSGRIITNLDGQVSLRLLTSGYTAPDNADIVSALADLVTLLGRTDPSSALTAIATALATLPSAASIVTALNADTNFKTILANVNGVFDYNTTTKALTLKDKAGGTTLATLTLTLDVNGVVTHRASA